MTEQTVASQIGHRWYARPVLFVSDINRALRFIELTADGLADFRRELAEQSVPSKKKCWGNDALQLDDPDGNELLFPLPN